MTAAKATTLRKEAALGINYYRVTEMTRQEDRVDMVQSQWTAETDILLVVFKEMIDDARQRLTESCPKLAEMVREMECGRR